MEDKLDGFETVHLHKQTRGACPYRKSKAEGAECSGDESVDERSRAIGFCSSSRSRFVRAET